MTIKCPYCDAPAWRRMCPRTGEICEWCCARCAAEKCASGVMQTKWSAAEQVALEVEILAHETLEHIADVVARWTVLYAVRLGYNPEPPMREAAESVIRQRLAGPPPVPPSQSSIWARLPDLLTLDDD